MGWLGRLLGKAINKGSPVREVVETVGENILPPVAVDVIETADKLGVDTVIAREIGLEGRDRDKRRNRKRAGR